jgi:prefoldin beta subunit
MAQSRAALITQKTENESVLLELKELGEDAEVFKMTGPVLLPQDKVEAVANVEKRLEFIQTELKRVEQRFQETQQAAMQQRQKVMILQQKLQGAGVKV